MNSLRLNPRLLLRASLGATGFVLVSPCALAAAAKAPHDPAHEYTIFLGLELTYDYQGVPCPVLQVDGDQLELDHHGTSVRLSVREGAFKTIHVPRLGRSPLAIDKSRVQRFASQDVQRNQDAIAQGFLMESVRAQAQEIAEIRGREAANDAAIEGARAIGRGQSPRNADQRGADALNVVNEGFASAGFASALPGASLVSIDDQGIGGPFDSCEIRFEITSAASIERAFGLLRLMIRDPANPRQPAAVIRFFPTDVLGPKPRPIVVAVRNLPTGFAIDGYSVHIFAAGHEVPTNLSRNRVAVSAEEAHQFLVLQYLQEHIGETLPVAIVSELLPASLRALISEPLSDATIEIEVDRDGHITEIMTGSELAPALTTALRQVCCFPALLNGRAVAGQGTFTLSEFIP